MNKKHIKILATIFLTGLFVFAPVILGILLVGLLMYMLSASIVDSL